GPLVPVAEVEDDAGYGHHDAEQRETAPEPQLLETVESARGDLVRAEHPAEALDPLPVDGVEEIVLHEDEECHDDREDEERADEVVQVLRDDGEPRKARVSQPRQDDVL